MTSIANKHKVAVSVTRRTLIGSGVGVFPHPPAGQHIGLAAGGGLLVTGRRNWADIQRILSDDADRMDVSNGWRGLAFLRPSNGTPMTIMRTDSLGHLLGLFERVAIESGRLGDM